MILNEWHNQPTTELQDLLQEYQTMLLEGIEEYKALDQQFAASPHRQSVLSEKNQENIELNMLINGLKLVLAQRDSDTLQASPPLPPLSESEILTLLNKGKIHRKEYHIHLSIEAFNTILRHHPQHLHALFQRGQSFMQAQDRQRAIDDFSAVITLQPDHVSAHRARSEANASLYKWRLVVEDETRVLELTPNDPVAYCNRGLAYSLLKQYDDSIADLTRAIKLNPTNASAYYYRADSYRNLGNYPQAIADCEEALFYAPQWYLPMQRIEAYRKELAENQP